MSVESLKARLVVTLTTIPSRIARIGPVIDSIKAQTRPPDGIYVCISERCLREHSPYTVPEWLREDESVTIVVSPRDYGPATKLIGMLDRERDPRTRIVIVDDDWAYSPNTLEVLERRFEQLGNAAVGASGGRLTRHWSEMDARIGPEIAARPHLRHQLVFMAESPEDVPVDILQFGFGALVLRGWFADDIRELVEPLTPLFFADDVLFSGYLESHGIRRVCLAGLPLPRRLEQWSTRPLHGDGRATRNYKAAIPALSARLGIWEPTTLLDPRPPRRAVLRHAAARFASKAHGAAATWQYRLALLKSQCMYRYFPGRLRAMRTFYGSMLAAGDLCFDLGSHIGNRTDVLTSLSCRVVAVEPQPFLAAYLRRRFARNPAVVVDERAVSGEAGEATLHWSPQYLTVSSLKPDWVDSLQAVRSHNIVFTESQRVATTTVGDLIRTHGRPRYCKIDVEGADLAVIRSLPVPIDIVSFEHLPHGFDATSASLAALETLAGYRYNYFIRESHRFEAHALMSGQELLRELRNIADRRCSCDIFAFRQICGLQDEGGAAVNPTTPRAPP